LTRISLAEPTGIWPPDGVTNLVPTASTTSASSRSRRNASASKASRCRAEIAPRQFSLITTGARSTLASSRKAPAPSAASTPPPAKITGRRARPSIAAARSSSPASGTAGAGPAGPGISMPALEASTSGGISSPTGRGRPERSSAKARCTSPGICSGRWAIPLHLVSVRKIADWPGISCNAPRPLPMTAESTWPAM
jgi:hypothetical protein